MALRVIHSASRTHNPVDSRGRHFTYARISVTDRCNYRCVYCMPTTGVPFVARTAYVTADGLRRLAGACVRLGIDTIRLTGGEPLLRPGIVDIVRAIKGVAGIRQVALTTNGHLLDTLARPLREAGLDRLNVSVDGLDAADFRAVTRFGDLRRVMAGVEAARKAGFSPLAINMVAVRRPGWEDSVRRVLEYAWTGGDVPRFIEVMPMAGVTSLATRDFLGTAEVAAWIGTVYGRLDPGGEPLGRGPSRYWVTPAGHRIGFISPLTGNFCESCNRLRVTATGQLKGCLTDGGLTDLRPYLRDDGQVGALAEVMDRALQGKQSGHDFAGRNLDGRWVAMSAVGG